MLKVVAFTLEAVGMPMVMGGNARTVDAFRQLIENRGGTLLTGCDVERVLVEGGKAVGVALGDGRRFMGRDVVCNVTPTQLYGRLLAPEHTPQPLRQQAAAYRYGKGNMQIHLALSEPVQWCAPELASVGYVHMTPGLHGVARAVDEAQRGLLPAEGTICVGQPSAVDPSRAPAGGSVLWVQLPECPRQARNHETPVQRLWHIGASTHPGPGLGGTSGMHVANRLARP